MSLEIPPDGPVSSQPEILETPELLMRLDTFDAARAFVQETYSGYVEYDCPTGPPEVEHANIRLSLAWADLVQSIMTTGDDLDERLRMVNRLWTDDDQQRMDHLSELLPDDPFIYLRDDPSFLDKKINEMRATARNYPELTSKIVAQYVSWLDCDTAVFEAAATQRAEHRSRRQMQRQEQARQREQAQHRTELGYLAAIGLTAMVGFMLGRRRPPA